MNEYWEQFDPDYNKEQPWRKGYEKERNKLFKKKMQEEKEKLAKKQ